MTSFLMTLAASASETASTVADKFAVSDETYHKVMQNPDKVFFPNFGGGDNVLSEGFTVNRVLFTIPGINFKVYWYGFLIAVGILLAMIYGFRKMRSVGINPDRATDGVIAGFFGALAFARLYYILFNSDISLKEFFNFREGGLAIYGGIIGAVVCGGIVIKLRKIKLAAMLDVVAPCFLIGQCIGRWGNFFNQEAFGATTDLPWGMMSSKTVNYLAENCRELSFKAPVHPCFLYESIWCLAAFIILHIYFKHRKFDGEVFLMYAGIYGLGRFFIEATRTDSLYLMNIKVSQLVAGASVIAALVLIIIFRNMVKRNDDYKLFVDTDLSKAQLKEYDSYEADKKAKKELKQKIADAKAAGESTVELKKEYEEQFGKNAKKPSDDVKEDDSSSESYKSILEDDDASEEDTGEKADDDKEADEADKDNDTTEEENSNE